jgi:hypothetical protein
MALASDNQRRTVGGDSLLERWFTAGDEGDLDAFDDFLHPDVVVHAPQTHRNGVQQSAAESYRLQSLGRRNTRNRRSGDCPAPCFQGEKTGSNPVGATTSPRSGGEPG